MDRRRFALLFSVLALELGAARLALGDGSFAELFAQYARLYRRSGAGELIRNSRLVVVLLVLVAVFGDPLVDFARRRRATAGLAMDPLLAQVPVALLAILAVSGPSGDGARRGQARDRPLRARHGAILPLGTRRETI